MRTLAFTWLEYLVVIGMAVFGLVILPRLLLRKLDGRVCLLGKQTTLGPAWLQLESGRALPARRRQQEVRLKFLEPLSMNPRTTGWGPIGARGKGVLPDVALRDQQGQWHECGGAPSYLNNDWLVYG